MFLCGEINKPRSLVEQKKLQWAKERGEYIVETKRIYKRRRTRVELENFSPNPVLSTRIKSVYSFNDQELAKLSVPWGKVMKAYEKSVRARNHQKAPSENYYHEDNYTNNLPPIVPKQIIPRNDKYQEYDRYEVEGSSGYASDSNKEGSPEHQSEKPVQEYQIWSNWHRSEPDLNERPKWGDRGLGVGHLWEPKDLTDTARVIEPPGWLQRGLRRDKELIVSQSPDQQSQQSDYLDRPFTGESTITNTTQRTHLRGQNIPLEPTEIIERERKRQKALELQSAIKQQLEEREIKRKQEHERLKREEVELEERIRREQEIERRRAEEEQRAMKEKKEREKQRREAMEEALVAAEKEAKEKKQKSKKSSKKNDDQEESQKEPPKSQPKLEYSPARKPTKSADLKKDKPVSAKKDENKNDNKYTETELAKIKPENLKDNVIVLQNPFDNMQNMQIALLLPSSSVQDSKALVPLSDKSYMTENRVLTPSVYRCKKSCRETSTQTDIELKVYSDKFIRDDNMGSLDRNRARSRAERRDKRFRSEDRSKENRERPKWGANRPTNRYMKQSEKDPVYQKRKLRQKTREIQLIYEDKNNNYSQSSDDSAPVTPEHKAYRQNRSQWHKNGRMFSQNISVYQTEILPLEFDRQGRMYVKDQDYQEEDRRYPRKKYRERFTSPDRYAIERLSPKYDDYSERSDHRKMTDRDDDSERTDNEEVLEKLNSLHKGLMIKQKQWDNDNAHVRSSFPNV